MKQLFYKTFAFLLFSSFSISLFGQQPTVFASSLVNGTYTFYSLTDQGNFRQVRIQATSSGSVAARNWEFCRGTVAVPDFTVNWRPNIGGQIITNYNTPINPISSSSSARYHSSFGGSAGLLNAITQNQYYTINITENSTSDNYMSILETTYNPVSINSVTQCPVAGITNLSGPTVTVTTSTSPSASEFILLRYSTDGWVTSSVLDVPFSGTTGSVVIPAQSNGTVVSYYVYSSNVNASSINSLVTSNGQVSHDMMTLKLNNNLTANYNYTVVTPVPLTGTYTINNNFATGGTNFNNFVDAFCILNMNGTASPGVTFDVQAGYTETLSNIVLTAEGNINAPIVFEKAGAGVNPTLTASAGSGSMDGLIKLAGCDYVTFDGFTLQDAAGNSNATTRMEHGFGLFKKNSSSPINGCQHNTIKNCTIVLNKANANTYGIYVANQIVNNASSISLNNTSDANSYNQFFSNIIKNVNYGVYINGYSGQVGLYDLNNDIGGNVSTNGNTIQNFGGTVNGLAIGVYVAYQNNCNISQNNIDNTASGGSVALSAVYGIYHFTSDHSSATISNNNIVLARGTGISDMAGVRTNLSGSGTISIEYNTVNLQALAGCSGVFYCIQQEGGLNAVNINYNNFNNINSVFTTGGGFAIYNSNLSTINNIGYNYITTVFSKSTSSSGALRFYYDNSGVSNGVTNFHHNNFSNMTGTGTTAIIGIDMVCMATEQINIYENQCTALTAGNLNGAIAQVLNLTNQGVANIYNNTFSNIATYGNVDGIVVTGDLGSVFNIYGNKLNGFTSSGPASSVTAINIGTVSDFGTYNIYNNKIYDLSDPSLVNTGLITGINCGNSSTQFQATINAYNNFIGDLRAPIGGLDNQVRGMYFNSSYSNLYFNTVYLNASSTAATFGSTCVFSNWTNDLLMKNNVFINLSTPGTTAGRSVAFRIGNTTYSFWETTSNNNIFYVSSPSTRRNVFFDGVNADQTMAAFQSHVTPRELQSISVLPVFASTTGSNALFLHLDPSVNCNIKGKGTAVNSITVDADGDLRDATYPSQGADELISTDPGYWTGMINTDWHNNFNWCGFLVPTSVINVTVPSAVLNQPVITLTANSNDLNIQSGATLQITNGSLNVSGNFTKAGTYTHTGGTLRFSGTSAQTVSGSLNVTSFEMNNSAGATLLNGDLNISSLATFTAGALTPTNGYKVNITSSVASAVVSGSGNTNYNYSYVNGLLQRSFVTNSNSYDFPVGMNGNGNLLQIVNNNAAGISSFQVSFVSKAGTDVGLNVTEGGSPYLSVNCLGVWNVVPTGSITSGNCNLKAFIQNFSGLTNNTFAILSRPSASSNAVDWVVPAGSSIPAINNPGRTISSGYAQRNSVTTFNQLGIGQTSGTLITQQPTNISTCDLSTVTFTLNSASNLTYQWQENNGGGFLNLSNTGIYNGVNTANLTLNGVSLSMNGFTYRCIVGTTGLCTTSATSNSATLTVNVNAAPTVSVSANQNPICLGSGVNFTANSTNAGATPTYSFKVNGLVVQSSLSNSYSTSSLINGDVVSCTMATSGACLIYINSNQVTMIVNPNLIPLVSISNNLNNVCAGTQVSFTATPTNGGASPVYNFKMNNVSVQNGSSNVFNTSSLNNNDAVTCTMTANNTCQTTATANSNSIVITVNPNLVPSVSLAASVNNVCAGTSITFTATPTNGGSAPLYNFKVNNVSVQNGSNNVYVSSTLNNSDIVKCVMVSNNTCQTASSSTSNSITLIINPNLTPSVSIAAQQNNVCAGTSVLITATPTNGGSAPAYNFKVNNISVQNGASNLFTSAFNNGDVVTCTMTANNTCQTTATANSNSVTMVVNVNLIPSVSINASANNVCAGTSISFTATPTNGGPSPVYNFKVNNVSVQSGSSNTYVSSSLTNAAVVTCVMTSNNTCQTTATSTSNAISMVINPNLVPSVSISYSQNPICVGSLATVIAAPTNGGSNPQYDFFVNNSIVQSGSSNVYSGPMNNSDQTTCTMTSNNTCQVTSTASSSAIMIYVLQYVTPTIDITATTIPACVIGNITFNASTTYEGTSPNYKWYYNDVETGSGQDFIDVNAYADSDKIYCILISNYECLNASSIESNHLTVSTIPLQPFFADLDGDGYGDFGNSVQDCTPPSGYVVSSDDCNDSDAGIHPHASATGLSAIPLTSSCSVSWNPGCCGWKFLIRRRAINTTSWVTKSTNAPTKNLTGLLLGTQYEYQVRSIYAIGDTSPWTSSSYFTTLPSCPVPINLSTTNVTSHTAKLHYASAAASASYYIRYRSIDSVNWIVITRTAPSTLYSLTGLVSNKTYYWQIRHKCGGDNSPWSPAQVFNTLSGPRLNGYVEDERELILFPNPGEGIFTLTTTFNEPQSIVIIVTDLFGKEIQRMTEKVSPGDFDKDMDLSPFVSGTYLIQVISKEGVLSKPFIKQD